MNNSQLSLGLGLFNGQNVLHRRHLANEERYYVNS